MQKDILLNLYQRNKDKYVGWKYFKNKQDRIFVGSMKKLKLKNKGKDVHIYKGKDLLAKVKGAKGDLSKKGKYFV